MFSRLSHLGIVFDNLRELSLSLTVSSLVAPLVSHSHVLTAAGVCLGVYYGYRIEKQTHELSSLGGRVLKGREWDYLVMA